VAKDLKSATSAKSMGLDALKDAADKFEKWDPKRPVKSAATAAAAAVTGAAAAPEGSATRAMAEEKAAKAAAVSAQAETIRAARDEGKAET